MTTAAATKLCVKCGKDVTHDKRMKDSHGKYWCVTCGKSDTEQKHHRLPCADCRGKYDPGELTEAENGEQVCSACLKGRRATTPGAGADTGAELARKRKLQAVAAFGLLALGATLLTLTFLEVL